MVQGLLRRLRADGMTPLVLLLVSVLAFGLQLPWLGYYVDDWIILHALNIGGAERIFEYAFLGNRPLVFWLWWGAFRLLGSAPLPWHIWALLWRWLAVVMIWLGWRPSAAGPRSGACLRPARRAAPSRGCGAPWHWRRCASWRA